MKHIPKIEIQSIPHKRQRYETAGDYYFASESSRGAEETLYFRVSNMNAIYEFLVIVHEFIEWFLTNQKGIKIKAIDTFDMAYENARKAGIQAPCGCKPTSDSEPGFDKHAPYYSAHKFATRIEKMLAISLGVDWEKYDKAVCNL